MEKVGNVKDIKQSQCKLLSYNETNNLNKVTALITKPIANSTNLPNFTANSCIVFSMMPGEDSNFDVQLAFSFGQDKIAIRRKSGSYTWTDWKYFTAS